MGALPKHQTGLGVVTGLANGLTHDTAMALGVRSQTAEDIFNPMGYLSRTIGGSTTPIQQEDAAAAEKAALDAQRPLTKPDLTDEVVQRARRAQMMRTSGMQGRKSTFLTGAGG